MMNRSHFFQSLFMFFLLIAGAFPASRDDPSGHHLAGVESPAKYTASPRLKPGPEISRSAEDSLGLGQQALINRDFASALVYFRQSAKKGVPAGQCALGLMFEKGLGVKRDYAKAKLWFERSARKGDPGGQNNMGVLYHSGWGVKRDDSMAVSWFRKAARGGLGSAQMNLALMAAQGEGMERDWDEAYYWFQKAARQGDEEAQVNLGQMASLGEGTPKDLVESYKWFLLALRHDGLEAGKTAELQDEINWLKKRLSAGQISEAKKRADQFKPSPTDVVTPSIDQKSK